MISLELLGYAVTAFFLGLAVVIVIAIYERLSAPWRRRCSLCRVWGASYYGVTWDPLCPDCWRDSNRS